jgi:hypothetical protein
VLSFDAQHTQPAFLTPGSTPQQAQQQQQQQQHIGGDGLCIVWRPRTRPPHPSAAAADMVALGLLPVAHLEPFYGKAADKPQQPTVFAGREFRWGCAVVCLRYALPCCAAPWHRSSRSHGFAPASLAALPRSQDTCCG